MANDCIKKKKHCYQNGNNRLPIIWRKHRGQGKKGLDSTKPIIPVNLPVIGKQGNLTLFKIGVISKKLRCSASNVGFGTGKIARYLIVANLAIIFIKNDLNMTVESGMIEATTAGGTLPQWISIAVAK